MRGAARCSTDGRGPRDSCSLSLSLYNRSCYVRPPVDSLTRPAAAAFLSTLARSPALCCTPKSGVVGRSPASLPTGGGGDDDGLFSFSCQGTTQSPSFVRSVTVQGSSSQSSSLSPDFVCCQVRLTASSDSSFPRDTQRNQPLQGKWPRARKGERRKGLGLSNNNAASGHNTDVRQAKRRRRRRRGFDEWPWRFRSLSFSVREEERR